VIQLIPAVSACRTRGYIAFQSTDLLFSPQRAFMVMRLKGTPVLSVMTCDCYLRVSRISWHRPVAPHRRSFAGVDFTRIHLHSGEG
jgi:hypothetical protein